MLCVTGYTEANTSTQAVSKLEILPLTEAHLIFVPFLWLLGCDLSIDGKILVSRVDMFIRLEYPTRTRRTNFR